MFGILLPPARGCYLREDTRAVIRVSSSRTRRRISRGSARDCLKSKEDECRNTLPRVRVDGTSRGSTRGPRNPPSCRLSKTAVENALFLFAAQH
jgi:hypothetical protein